MQKKYWLFALVLLVAAAAGAVFLDPTCTALGWLRGEKFYAGRPTTYWRRALRDPSPSAQSEALGRLKEGGGDAVPVLVELLGTSPGGWEGDQVRWKAAELLGHLGRDARPAVPALLAALDDPDAHVRSVATSALALVGPAEEVVPALVSRLDRDDRAATARALSHFKADAAPAIPGLVRLLRDADSRVRWNAARTLGKIGAAARTSVPELVTALKDEESSIREHAAEALGDIGPAAAEAVPALVQVLKDPDFKVRRDAARSLGQMGPAARAALPGLRALQKDENQEVRAAAARSVRQLDPESVVPKKDTQSRRGAEERGGKRE